jgi:hypothetical protein
MTVTLLQAVAIAAGVVGAAVVVIYLFGGGE